MQLILNSETELGVNRTMSALDEESLDEKLVYDDINDIKNGEITSVKKELIFECLDEKLANVENIYHKSDNISIANTGNINSVSNTNVKNLEIKNPPCNSIDDNLFEPTNNSSQETKYNMMTCENNDRTLESQKSIIDDENMDLVLQKEAEILDDQECVEDLISLAKEISESNEKINIDSNIGERSELDIANTDILDEESTQSVQIESKNEKTGVFKEISLDKSVSEEKLPIIDVTKIITDKVENKMELDGEQHENIDTVETELNNLNNQSRECEELNDNNTSSCLNTTQESDSADIDKCIQNVIDNPENVLSPKITMTEVNEDVRMKEEDKEEQNNVKEIDALNDNISQNSKRSLSESITVNETNIVDKNVEKVSKDVNETVIMADETNIPEKNIEKVLNEANHVKATNETVTEDVQEKKDTDTADKLNVVHPENMEGCTTTTVKKDDEPTEPVLSTVLSPKETFVNETTDLLELDSKLLEENVDDIQTCDSDKKETEMQDEALNEQHKENVPIHIEESKKEDAKILRKTEEKEEILSDNNIDEPMELDTTVSSDTVILKSPTCTKQVPKLCRLSNNLDILSDDDDDHNLKENAIPEPIPMEKKNTTDEDDIMIIDEDTNAKNIKEDLNEMETDDKEKGSDTKNNESSSEDCKNVKEPSEEENRDKKTSGEEEEAEAPAVEDKNMQPEISEKSLENENDKPKSQKPLLAENFLSTCKKNFAHMTRDDLEEFCILKIVESIVDRSSLSEIKSKIKIMSQNLEEYKKKAMTLTKQNRDLQVVLKSVQEEQKKRTGAPITPLKITRSVGMQILMTEPSRRKGAGGIMIPVNVSNGNLSSSIISNNSNTRQLRNTTNQNQRNPKSNNVQQIPVPRLVPASNNLVTKTPSSANTNNVKTNSPSPIPNGIKNSTPSQKPAEKRAHSRISLSPSSVTVDLTDDEPPLKVTARSPTVAPVRLVPPQTLMAPQRPQFGQQVNSPRKVYIPISGPQGPNVRPGQSIVLKSLPPQGPRTRGPGPGAVVRPPQSGMRRVQGVRHPAPLPDAMKQYQPPNWKALPPAPDLKLSKVENGIVISWKIEGYQEDSYEEIASYQLYAYQETSSPPSTALWKKIGDVKALPLPMACTLTQFMAGYKYYFAVRAVDVRSRVGPFSLPGSILLLSKT